MNQPAPRITPVLPPVDESPPGSAHELRIHDRWTDALAQTYGGGVLQGPITRRISQGLDAFLDPLRAVWPRSWQFMREHCVDWRFLEHRYPDGETFASVGLWPLLQLPNTFVRFGYWLDGHCPWPFPPDEAVADFRGRVARLPAFLANLYRDFCEISLNDTSPHPQLPDLSMVHGMPYGASRLPTLLGRRKGPAALKAFTDVDELKVITQKGPAHGSGFLLFFDDSEAGEGRVFALLEGQPKDLFEVQDVQDTLDRQFVHHLAGESEAFDLRASLTPIRRHAAG